MQQQSSTAGNFLPMEFKDSTNRSIRVQMVKDQPHFIAKDVCDILGLSHITEAMKKLDEDEKLTAQIMQSGQHRSVWLVNESGLYNLIFRSNKPEAKLFRKWVTSEVLPSLRKQGSYELPKAQPQAALAIAPAYADLLRKFRKNVTRLYVNQVAYYHLVDVVRLLGMAPNVYSKLKYPSKKSTLGGAICIGAHKRGSWYVNEQSLSEYLLTRRSIHAQTLHMALFAQSKGGLL